MIDTYSESARVLRQLGDVVDALQRVLTAVGQLAREHADCESVLDAIGQARGHLAGAELALHDHARAFEAVVVDDDRGARELG